MEDTNQDDTLKVDLSDAAKVDWSRHCFPIGVEVDGDVPWLKLDEDDLKILHGLLTARLNRFPNSAETNISTPPASEVSDPLRRIALWAKAAAEWCEMKRKERAS